MQLRGSARHGSFYEYGSPRMSAGACSNCSRRFNVSPSPSIRHAWRRNANLSDQGRREICEPRYHGSTTEYMDRGPGHEHAQKPHPHRNSQPAAHWAIGLRAGFKHQRRGVVEKRLLCLTNTRRRPALLGPGQRTAENRTWWFPRTQHSRTLSPQVGLQQWR